MKPRTMLVISSLISILLFLTHVADDIARGFEKGQLENLPLFLILLVWMYGTLILRGRAGYGVMLLGAILSAGVPVLHMMGRGLGPESRIAGSPGALFFIWTVIALGAAGWFSTALAIRALWKPHWASASPEEASLRG
jgi:hypothetical protein